MFKHLQKLLLIVALLVPWVTQAQNLSDYTFSTGTDQTKWVDMTNATQILTPSSTGSDGLASSLQDIPFSFPFGEGVYTQYSVNTDGNMRLGPTATLTGSYSTPFSTSYANANNPKINAFGCDGYGVSGSHYVKAMTAYDLSGDSILCVEFCMGTFNSTTRNNLYTWQIHLFPNGNIEIVFPDSTVVPPVVAHQCGLCYDKTDGWVISASSNTATWFDNGSSTTNAANTWFDSYRYYSFVRPVITCPKPLAVNAETTADEMTVVWTPGGSESLWELVVGENVYYATDTFYTVSNLEPNTQYNVAVRAICGVEDSSGWRNGSFRTECVMISSMPYVNDFENEPYYLSGTTTYAEAFPYCWTRINDASGTNNYYPYISTTASYVHSGSNGMCWYHTTSTTYANNEYAVLPPVDPDAYTISDLTLSFYAKTTSASYHPQPIVGVMTDPTADSTFTAVHTFTATDITTDWQLFTVSFADYEGEGNYIAIKWPRPTSTCYLAIDDIYLTDEWCDVPVNVAANCSANEVTVSWESNGGTSFTVVLDADTVSGVTDTFYVFDNLAANTEYHYAVANECTSAISSFIGGDIRTLCEPIEIPYTENFDSMTASTVPLCFTKIGNGSALVNNSSTYSHSGTMSVKFSGATSDNILVLPLFDEPINNLMLTVWTRPESYTSANCGSFQIGYITNMSDPSSFVALANYQYSDFSAVEERSVMFGNAPENALMALRHTAGSTAWYWFVDDISVDLLPSCPDVTDLRVDHVTAGSAMVSWNYMTGTDSEPTGFSVSFDAVGGNNPVTFTTAEMTHTFTGLTPGTAYEVSVRVDCGGSFGSTSTLTFSAASLGCLVPDTSIHDTIIIGTGTETSSYLPSYSFYNYGLSQQIYTAEEMNGSKVLTGIAVMPANVSQQRTYEIYLAHTNATDLSGSYLHPADMMKVKNAGTVNLVANQWIYYEFDTTFAYNGSDNLLVCFRDMTGDYVSGNTFYVHAKPSNSIYSYQDASAYDPYTQATGTVTAYRDNMMFMGSGCSQTSTCSSPAVYVTNIDTAEIEISWLPGYDETAWDIDYRAVGTDTWTSVATSVTSTNYTIIGLNPGEGYEFRVSHQCGDVTYSGVVKSTTNCVPAHVPFVENFDTWQTGTTGELPSICWYKYTNYSTTYYPYVSNSYAHSGSQALYLYSTNATYSYLALPLLDVQLDSLQVSFWMMKTNTTYAHSAQVGVMTDVTDPSTFTLVATVENSESNEWEYFDVPLSNYHGEGRIVLRSPDGVYSYPYVDDISVDYLPTCPRVTDVYLAYAAEDTIILKWTAGGEETLWEVQVDSNVYYSDADSIVIDQLASSTLYDFAIRAICDEEDTSNVTYFRAYSACGKINSFPFSEDFEAVPAGSSSSTSEFGLPCWRHLNNGTSYGGYPYVSSSSTYNHTPGGTKGLYWYAYTTVGTYGDYMILVLPEVDTNVAPMNTLMFTFWAKPSSTSYQPVFYVGTMSSPDSLESFVYVDTVNIDYSSTNWVKYSVMLDNLPDSVHHSYVALRANRPVNYWYAYVDDITLDLIPDCSPVEEINVETSATSAIVQWTTMGDSYIGAQVEYRPAGTTTWNTLSVTGTHYAAITGLTPATEYEVVVSATCIDDNGNQVNSTPVSDQFVTKTFGCSVVDSSTFAQGTIGTGTSQTTGVPVVSAWGNSLSQTIYTASELLALGFNATGATITDITYTWTANATYAKVFSIYMTNTLDSVYAGSSSPFIATGSGALVYSGDHPLNTSGSVTYHLQTPFQWDGHSNLCITTTMNQPNGTAHTASSFYGLSSNSNATRTLYKYQDSNPLDGSNPTAITASSSSTYRPNITLTSADCIQQSTCSAPAVIVAGVGTNTVDIAWAPGNAETSWNLYYRHSNNNAYTLAATGVTATTYQFTGLNSGSKYEFLIVSVCADSVSARVEATTECAAITSLPFYESFDNWGTGTGTLPSCWSRNGSYSTYTYLNSSYNHGNGSGASVYMYQGSSESYTSRIILPELDTNVYQANQTQLVFSVYYVSTSYTPAHFEVGVTTDPDDPSTFVPVDTVYHSGSAVGTWEDFEVPLANYTGNGAYVTLKTFYTSGYDYTYLDDFYLELIPTCPRPDSLIATGSTTSSVDLSWHERGSATNWIVEYGPIGFTPGTGTTVAASSNPFTLSGLPSSYIGEYYVRSVCGYGDTGLYSRNGCLFSTSQIPATLPYDYNFEDATEFANWQSCSNVTTNWYRGTAVNNGGSNSMYISVDAGATYKPYQFNSVVNAAIYRDIDFGTVDSSFTISFDARVGGNLGASYDGLMVFLVDPSVPAIASNSNITSPWGNVNDLYIIRTVRIDTNWNTYTASFDTIHGIKRVAFFWFNQNTGSTSSYGESLLEPAAVDNIHIDYSSCPRPIGLTANAGPSTAALSWTGNPNLNYEVVYRPNGASASQNVHVMANTNHINIGGLNMLNEYRYWVRKYCGAGDTSLWSDGFTFKTTYCDVPDTINFGDSTSTTGTSYNYPVNNFYRYTLCEIIIDSAELGDNTMFDAIAFNYNYATASSSKPDVDIYIMPTTASTFASTSDIHELDSTATLVYSGPLNCEQGWNMFGFMQPYVWDGHSNLMLVIDDNSNDYDGSAYVFNTRSCSGYKTITYYSDSYNPDPLTISSSYSGSKTYYQYRPEMMLLNCATSCSAPNTLSASAVTYNSATLNWNGSAESYEIAVKAATDAAYPEATAVTGNSFNVTGLIPSTLYRFQVRSVCDAVEGEMSDWVEATFTTEDLPCFAPTNLHQTTAGYTTVTLDWTVVGAENNWMIHMWDANFDTTVVVNTHPATVGGLQPAWTYSATVRALCGDATMMIESEESEATTANTLTCEPVTGLTVTNVTAHSAQVTWNGTASSYTIEYGPEYFGVNTGARVTGVTGNSYTINNLEEDYSYDVYVRAECEPGVSSAWGTKVTFHTLEGSGVYYTITVLVNDPAMGTATGGGTFEAGATTTLVATPNNGYDFVKWDDGVTDATRTITVTGDATYTANFKQHSAVDVVDGMMNLSIYPNPTRSSATVALSGVNGEVTVTVVDMNGRVVKAETMSCSGDCTKRMDVEELAQGAYFVRVNGENINMVKKLIVK